MCQGFKFRPVLDSTGKNFHFARRLALVRAVPVAAEASRLPVAAGYQNSIVLTIDRNLDADQNFKPWYVPSPLFSSQKKKNWVGSLIEVTG